MPGPSEAQRLCTEGIARLDGCYPGPALRAGKSTVSALLCGAGPAGAALASCVSAHHFVKYSDARRLDPVRIVKSLAFQLAVQ
jgi:hypothetical protein